MLYCAHWVGSAVAKRFLGMEKVPVPFLAGEEEDGAGRSAQSGGTLLPEGDDELQAGLGKGDSLARGRIWNSLLWMFMAVPAELTFTAARIYCWILMLP